MKPRSSATQEGRLLHRADRKARPRHAIDVLAEILPVIIRTFPWPKSMRWGERSAQPGSLSWVRPLHAIIATFGLETEEPDVVEILRRRHRGRPDHVRPPLHGAGAISGAPLRGLRSQAAGRKSRARSAGAQGHHPRRRQAAGVRARLRAGRGPGAARRGRRPRRMAGRADGIVRQGISRDPGRGDPRHHPQQPEMLRRQRSQDRQARPTSSSSPPISRPATAARRSSPATSA